MYHELKSVIKGKYGQDACNVGDEGGFAPNIQSNLEGIELLMAAIKKAGYEDKVSYEYNSTAVPGPLQCRLSSSGARYSAVKSRDTRVHSHTKSDILSVLKSAGARYCAGIHIIPGQIPAL